MINVSMESLLSKFQQLERVVAKEKGEFLLFALGLRDDVPDSWDLVVAAAWASENRPKAVEYLVEQIRSIVGVDGLRLLARVVVLDASDPVVQSFGKELYKGDLRLSGSSDKFGQLS